MKKKENKRKQQFVSLWICTLQQKSYFSRTINIIKIWEQYILFLFVGAVFSTLMSKAQNDTVKSGKGRCERKTANAKKKIKKTFSNLSRFTAIPQLLLGQIIAIKYIFQPDAEHFMNVFFSSNFLWHIKYNT